MSTTQTTTARPYKGVDLTPENIAYLVGTDLEGLLDEVRTYRSPRTLRKVTAEMVRQVQVQATVTIARTPEPKVRPTKYGRTASGRAVSTVAGELAKAAHAEGEGYLRDLYPQAVEYVKAHLDEF